MLFRSYKNDKEKRSVGGIAAVPDSVEPVKPPEPVKDSLQSSQGIVNQNTKTDTLPSRAVYFTVQIGAVPASVPSAGKKYDQVPDAHFLVGEDGMKRYYSGKYDSVEKAKRSQNQLRTSGFKDAFVCAFSDGKRISVADAVQLLKTK